MSVRTNYEEFENLIKKDSYQVFLMSCPCTHPIAFAQHPWFVTNKKGTISRWEVHHKKGLSETSWGHVYLNTYYYSPFQGVAKYPFSNAFGTKPKLLGLIEDDEALIAQRFIKVIESSPNLYLYRDFYNIAGPNSNTYFKWILKQFPEISLKLPWNYIG